MKLTADRLDGHLAKGLAPIYVIAGEELLVVLEAADAIRAAARRAGFTDREVFNPERGFDWAEFAAAGASLSLFATKRIIELRLPTGKPGDAGGKALQAYAAAPPEDTILLVTCGKLDGTTRKAKWLGALERAGVWLEAWPVDARRLPVWIQQRMGARGMRPTPDAVRLLAERCEGNLLAASQEVEKLLLLNGPGAVTVDAIHEAVVDSARFDLFGLVDTALEGDAGRALRMLEGLRGEGTEPVLIAWGLVREVRSLAAMAWAIWAGQPQSKVLASVWQKRRPLVAKALARADSRQWRRLLQQAARCELVVKGQLAGRPWDELLILTAGLAGRLPPRVAKIPASAV